MEHNIRKTGGGRELGLLTAVSVGALALSGVLYAAGASAQETLPGVIDRPPVQVPPEVTRPEKVEPKKEPEMERPEKPGEVVATLKEVKFSGTPILSDKALQKIVAPYLNRPLTREDIARLKYDLTKRYYDKGYVLVKVTTPPQDLSKGVLEVVVYPGRIGDLTVESNGLKPKVAAAMASRIVKGEVFRESTVETAVKDIVDLGNLKAMLNLRPGKELGTTDLLLTVEPAKTDVQQFMLDNYGSPFTGKNVATLDLNKSNLFHMGESVHLNLRKSVSGNSSEDMEAALLEFKTPIGWRNLKLELNYLTSRNDIGDYLVNLQSAGKTERLGAALSGTVVNMQARQIAWRAGVEARTLESWGASPLLETKDHISQVYAESSYLRRTPKYAFYGNLRVTKGVGIFGADSQGAPLTTIPGGDPQAWRLQPTAYGNFRITETDFVQGFFYGQMASSTLLASDLFVLGGYGSVRGFEPAKETGESGFQYTVEYSHQFAPRNGWTVKVGPFLDGGAVYNRVANAALNHHLTSVGLGVEAKAQPFRIGETKLRFDWAHPVGSYKLADGSDDPRVDNNTYYLRLTQNF